ncbi:MAG: hypothetical protein GXX93_03175 [Anaerolineae bacterium]|nr:hypothetical protein [Anaerolineae bacterium]
MKTVYQMRVQLPDKLRSALERAASSAGKTPEAWASEVLERQLSVRDERLRGRFGSVDLGRPTGADNDEIEADLARAYDGGEEG